MKPPESAAEAVVRVLARLAEAEALKQPGSKRSRDLMDAVRSMKESFESERHLFPTFADRAR